MLARKQKDKIREISEQVIGCNEVAGLSELVHSLITCLMEEKQLPTPPVLTRTTSEENFGSKEFEGARVAKTDYKGLKRFRQLLRATGHDVTKLESFLPQDRTELDFLLMMRKKIAMLHTDLINKSIDDIGSTEKKRKK